jgi:hypothetical protein
VPSQFAVGKNRIIHKPTTATFSFETAIPPSRASIGDVRTNNYHLAYITERGHQRVAQQLLSKLPRYRIICISDAQKAYPVLNIGYRWENTLSRYEDSACLIRSTLSPWSDVGVNRRSTVLELSGISLVSL